MKISVLASGSTGNTSLIMTGQHKILMDAGLSGKKTKQLLDEVGIDINEIDMAFLSHDHTDHSGGLGVLMRRYPKIDAFANSGTWQYLLDTHKIGKLPAEQMNVIEPGQTKTFGDLDVLTIPKSSNIKHMKENIEAQKIKLTDDDLRLINSDFPIPTEKSPLSVI